MKELFADANGIKICYEIKGEGDPVILVHGYAANKNSWIAQFGPLSERFKVIRFDLRRTGSSSRPNIPYTLDMLTDDIKGLMDFLNIQRASLVGWSLGGLVVGKFALKYPERTNKLILLFTTLGTPNEVGPELLKEAYIDVLKMLKEDPTKAFFEKARVLYTLKFRKQLEADPKKKFYGLWSVEDLIQNSITNPSTIQDAENLANALAKERIVGNLENIKAETLLVAASHNRLTPKSTMEELSKKISKTTFKVIDKAGHGAPISRAPEVNKLIIDFLSN